MIEGLNSLKVGAATSAYSDKQSVGQAQLKGTNDTSFSLRPIQGRCLSIIALHRRARWSANNRPARKSKGSYRLQLSEVDTCFVTSTA